MIRGPLGDASHPGFDALVCDLDGVVYRGDMAIPGAAAALGRLRASGVRLLFCTNNSRPTVAGCVRTLRSMGVEAHPDEVLTSAVVTADVLAERGLGGARAFVVGGEGLREELARVGIGLVAQGEAEVVAVGWDPSFDYAAMDTAARLVRSGAAFVATNRDATYPAPDGLMPGAGSILASIETAAGRAADVMGKPEPPMLDAIARRLDGSGAIAVVGDRPETDLAGASARGWKSILVLSGVTTGEQAALLQPAPDAILADLAALAPQ